MLAIDTVLVFFTAAVLLALTPGPDNLFVLTQAALGGRRMGLSVTLGLCTGLIVHTTLVAAGVAGIFASSRLAFNLLKFVGAAYLIYLAWGAFRASSNIEFGRGVVASSARSLYLRGIVMNVTNPKVALFFLAFLPQFTDPARGPVALQIMQLGGWFMLATLIVFGGVAWFSGAVGGWLRASPQASVIMHRAAGAIFLLLAVRLLIMER